MMSAPVEFTRASVLKELGIGSPARMADSRNKSSLGISRSPVEMRADVEVVYAGDVSDGVDDLISHDLVDASIAGLNLPREFKNPLLACTPQLLCGRHYGTHIYALRAVERVVSDNAARRARDVTSSSRR